MKKNIVIAGGTKGIGLELVNRLAADSAQVIVLSRNSGDELPAGVSHYPVDFADPESVIDESWLPETIHGAVYCPGSINLRSFRSLKPNDFRQDFELNLVGAVRFLQSCYRGLKKGSTDLPASVVLYSSVAAGLGMGMHSSVAASKSAIEGLTRSLAAEWAPDIRVNCIAPALTATPLSERLLSNPERREKMEASYPLKRIGKPEDIAQMSRYLLDQNNSWLTGQVMAVDGGMSSIYSG